MDNLLKTFKSLSDKNRMRIVKMLQVRPLCVCEMTVVLGLSMSTVSAHLSLLKSAGLIESFKDGRWIYYNLVKNPTSQEIASLLPLLSYWLNDDEIVKNDFERLKTVDRETSMSCC
ncbi:MAG: ArsR family transcriptional regulator [Calditrichaeota bacterium]|nr:MAG: ArsR family transcriptional regulator [Calditrichota bacterium]